MDVETYFGMIITILIGLTFIALFLAFLYMVYGEKEERAPSPKVKLFRRIFDDILRFML